MVELHRTVQVQILEDLGGLDFKDQCYVAYINMSYCSGMHHVIAEFRLSAVDS